MRLPWRREPEVVEERSSSDSLISLADWFNMMGQFSFHGVNYTFATNEQQNISGQFTSLAQQAMKSNGPVFACMLARQMLFSEARFQYRRLRNGKPGDLFGTSDLAVLEKPWPNGTTGDLLSRAIQDADLAGNAYFVRQNGGIRRLRPDWVSIVFGGQEENLHPWDPRVEIVGYSYKPGGPGSQSRSIPYLVEDVAHFAPIPDPEMKFRGMSWVTPVIREIMADKAASDHKLAFFENGATPNLVIRIDAPDLEQFKGYVEIFKAGHEGAANAYKTMFLANGADATIVGADMKQLDFKAVQGAGETRIAAAAGVPPVIVGLSEGLQAATYSNYGQARRRFADGTMRPLWRQICASLASIVPVPSDAELWYDDRDIMFLQEDRKDAAEIQAQEAQTIRTLVDAGFKPDTVIAAVQNSDFGRLEHTDLYSVQLQPPGTVAPPSDSQNAPDPAQNGANSKSDAELLARELIAALPNPED